MTSQFWLRRWTSIWFLYLIATDMITFVCHSWSNNQTCSKGTLMLKRFLACGSWNLIVLLPWYLIRRPISIYWNSYFAWRNKPNETHSFFYSWTVTLCFLFYSLKSRWPGWILMHGNWLVDQNAFILNLHVNFTQRHSSHAYWCCKTARKRGNVGEPSQFCRIFNRLDAFFCQLTQLISYVSWDILTLVMKISTWKRKPLSSLLANHSPFCLPMYFS